MSSHRGMNEYIAYPYTGTLHSNEAKWMTDIQNKMKKSQITMFNKRNHTKETHTVT